MLDRHRVHRQRGTIRRSSESMLLTTAVLIVDNLSAWTSSAKNNAIPIKLAGHLRTKGVAVFCWLSPAEQKQPAQRQHREDCSIIRSCARINQVKPKVSASCLFRAEILNIERRCAASPSCRSATDVMDRYEDGDSDTVSGTVQRCQLKEGLSTGRSPKLDVSSSVVNRVNSTPGRTPCRDWEPAGL